MDARNVVDTLNELIQTCEDGALGFRVCGDDADDLRLKTFFANRARGCSEAAEELQDLVRAYGGQPVAGGGWAGTLHRRWVDIRALISGRGDLAVLEECERGEEVALASYRRAAAQDLPAEVRAVVERQLRGVQHNHEQVRHLREEYRLL